MKKWGFWGFKVKGIRTKLLLGFVLFSILPLGIAGIYARYLSLKTLRTAFIRQMEYEVSSKAGGVEKVLDVMHKDVLVISNFQYLRDLVALDKTKKAAEYARLRGKVEAVFSAFARIHPEYFQVRYIDKNGYEAVRVDSDENGIKIIPSGGLQYKGDRYYFQESVSYSKGGRYISKMDINVEQGKMEIPPRPVIRIATPVYNGDMNEGIVIINLYAKAYIEQLNTLGMAKGGNVFMVDNRGQYVSFVGGGGGGKNAGFNAGTARNLEEDYTVDVARRLLSGKSGVENSKDFIIAYYPIHTGDSGMGQYWVLAIAYPTKILFSAIWNLESVLLSIGGVTILLIVAVGSRLARHFAEPVLRLREATELIANGNFNIPMQTVGTDDEIGDLSHSIFTMKEKLKATTENLTMHSHTMEKALIRAEEVLHLVSSPPPLIPFFDISPVYRSAADIGGGDSVRFLNFQSRYAALYLQDVSGHDIQALMLNILGVAIADNHKINVHKKSASLPAVFLAKMNEQLGLFCAETADYVTALYLLMNFEAREISLALAGHPNPWLINPDGVMEIVGSSGTILGQFEVSLLEKGRYADTVLRLKPGQMLLLYSDGLMEQEDAAGTQFGKKLKEGIVMKLAGLRPADAFLLLKDEFLKHLGGMPPGDDVSFVFVGTRPADKYETYEFTPGSRFLGGLISHPKATRRNIMVGNGACDAGGCLVVDDISEGYSPIIGKLVSADWPEKKINCVKSAMEEMLANAVLHGNLCSSRQRVRITYILQPDALEICVEDEGSGFDSGALAQVIDDGDLLKECGRGHHMICAHADNVYFSEQGNICWAIFRKHKDGE